MISDVIASSLPYKSKTFDILIGMKVPGIEKLSGIKRPELIDQILTEASDLSFGSTLNEQVAFTSRVESWVYFYCPSEQPEGTHAQYELKWEAIFKLVEMIIKWLPKLCLALEISNGNHIKHIFL